MKSRITYKGPLALYVSYFILLALSISLILLSSRVERESDLFLQLLLAGAAAGVVALGLIFHYTQIERRMNANKWRSQAESYYNDEGIFEYTPGGFTVTTLAGDTMRVNWREIVKAVSGESAINTHVKKFHIDLYFTEMEFITVDSTMPGFHLFEKRLKHNLRELSAQPVAESKEEEQQKTGVS